MSVDIQLIEHKPVSPADHAHPRNKRYGYSNHGISDFFSGIPDKEIHCSLIKICCPFLVKSVTIYMVFTKVPDADLLREGLRSLSFYLNKDSIMVYGWTIKRSGDGQDKKS